MTDKHDDDDVRSAPKEEQKPTPELDSDESSIFKSAEYKIDDVPEPYIVYAARSGMADQVQMQIDRGKDVNEQDSIGMTALHHAAALAARPCIRVLVQSGKCDYLIRDRWGRYASDLAIQWARDFAVGRLLSKKQTMQAFMQGRPAYENPR